MDTLSGTTPKSIIIQIEGYLEYLKALKYSHKTVSCYKNALNRFISFLTAENIIRVQDVSLNDLESYRLELVNNDYAGPSVSLYLRTVRKLFAYLEETRQIFLNPAQSLRVPKAATKLKPVPTEADMENLLSQPDISTPTGIRDRAILETFYSTGSRLTELVGMDVCDMDLKQGRIKITGKGNKERVVPMGKKAIFWTDKYLKEVRSHFLKKNPDEHALWLGFQGRRINLLIIERAVSEYGKMAAIKYPVTPHAMRRACATHMLRGGAHPVQIQMLLGHSSLRVLSHYLKVTITDLMKTHGEGRPGQ